MAYSIRELRGRKTLFVGEVNAGKTTLMSGMIEEAVTEELLSGQDDKKDRKQIIVIDLGPDLQLGSGRKVGGKLQLCQSTIERINYHSLREIYAPRIMGNTRKDVVSYAESNLTSIDRLLDSVFGSGDSSFETVFINDVTLYLHRGKAGRIVDIAERSRTFVANGYSGKTLLEDKGSGISANEASELGKLSSAMDDVIRL